MNWMIRGNVGYPVAGGSAQSIVLGNTVTETYHPTTTTNARLSFLPATPAEIARFNSLNPSNRSPLQGYIVSHGELGTVFPGTNIVGSVASPFTGLTTVHPAPNNTFQTYWVTSVVSGYESEPITTTAIVGTPTITNFPFLQEFETLSLPQLWSRSGSPNWRVWANPAEAYSGAGYAISINSSGTANNRLITPRFLVPTVPTGQQFMLIFQAKGIEGTNATLGVQLSTTGTAVADFSVNLLDPVAVSGADGWIERRIDLSSYAGQNIYIAFRHTHAGQSFLGIEDIWLGLVPAVNLTFPAPTGLTSEGMVGGTTVILEWDPISSPTTNFVGYNVYREDKFLKFTTDPEFSHTYPINGTHEYSVRAVYKNPTGVSTPISTNVPITTGQSIASRPSNPGLTIAENEGVYTTTITWDAPVHEYIEISQGGEYESGVGWFGNVTGFTADYHIAHRYSVAQLTHLGVTSGYIDRVSFIPYPDTTMATLSYRINIYTGGSVTSEPEENFAYHAGTLRHTQEFPANGLEPYEWNDIDLHSPVFIPPGVELLVGISAYATYRRPTANSLGMAVDNGPSNVSYGFLTGSNGINFRNVIGATGPLDYNWCLRAYVIADGADDGSAPIVLGDVPQPVVSTIDSPCYLQHTLAPRESIATISEIRTATTRTRPTTPTIRNTRGNLLGYTIYGCVYGEESGCLIPGELITGDRTFTYETVVGRWVMDIIAVYEGDVRSAPTIVDFFVGPFQIDAFPYAVDFRSVQFPPPGWTVIDQDDDGRNWHRQNISGVSFLRSQANATGGTRNWLISPKIIMPEAVMEDFRFFYTVRKNSPVNERIEFFVSTTGTAVADFSPTSPASTTIQNEGFNEVSRVLSTYANQEIYFAFVHATTAAGNGFLDIRAFRIDGTIIEVSDADEVKLLTTELLGNYPNPFNPETVIKYSVATEGPVTIEVFNIKGQKVATLLNDVVEAGVHEVNWNGLDNAGRNVSSGVYFYRMQTETEVSTRKMVLLK
jgi:hypothetical protein